MMLESEKLESEPLGIINDDYLSKREISLTLKDDIYVRYKSVNNEVKNKTRNRKNSRS